ncbi:MAG: hypothetical protein AAB875_03660 [Patescibacteria group bacterium]
MAEAGDIPRPGQGPEQGLPRPGEEYYRAAQQEQFARIDPGHETLKQATTPEVVIWVASSVLKDFEEPDKKDRSIISWSLTRYHEQLAARRRALLLTRAELTKFNIAEPVVVKGQQVVDSGGQPVLRAKIPGYGMEVKEISVETTDEEMVEEIDVDRETGQRKEGEKKIRVRRTTRTRNVEVTEFGTDEERQAMTRVYERAEQMMVVRQDLATLYIDIYRQNTASLENLVTLFHLGRNVPKLSNTELKTFFTLPDFNRVAEDPKDKTLGDCIDLADRLFEIAAASEFKGRLKELMDRPGWSEIVFEGMSPEDIKLWVGDVDSWVEDGERHKDSIDIEQRGLLTEFGNTWARRGKNDEAILLDRIGRFIARDYMRRYKADAKTALGVARTAVRLAYSFDKVSGFLAYLGREKYKKIVHNGKLIDTPVFPRDTKELEKLVKDKDRLEQFQKGLLLEGDPKTDDLTKLYHFRDYREKEFTRQRTAGPGITIPDSEERIALPLVLLLRTKTEHGWRSLHEQKWGYAEEGNSGDAGYMPKEPAKRMGDMNWDIWEKVSELKTLEPGELKELGFESEEVQEVDAWSLYTLFNWLAGREEPIKGIYQFYYAEDFDTRLFGSDAFWKGKSKFLKIVINTLVKSNGQYRPLYAKAKKQNPGAHVIELTDKVDGELGETWESSYDKNRKLFVMGMANLPNTKVWKAATLETQESMRGVSIPYSVWALARDTAMRAGFPFPEEEYTAKSK